MEERTVEKEEDEEGGRVKWGDYSVISSQDDREHNYSEPTLSHDLDLWRFKVLRTSSTTCKSTLMTCTCTAGHFHMNITKDSQTQVFSPLQYVGVMLGEAGDMDQVRPSWSMRPIKATELQINYLWTLC